MKGRKREAAKERVGNKADLQPSTFNQQPAASNWQPATVLLLDLSNDKTAALMWSRSFAAESATELINKAELKWSSKRAALARLRGRSPQVFAVFATNLETQSARRALLLFGALTGAQRIIIGDRHHTLIRSRRQVVFSDMPRLAFEYALGYGLLAPLLWVMTWAIGICLPMRAVMRASQIKRKLSDTHAPQSVLYLRATLSAEKAGGMITHVKGFVRGAEALGHRVKLITVSEGARDFVVSRVLKPSAAVSANKALFELWSNLIFTLKSWRWLEQSREAEFDFIYQRYSRFNWTGAVLSFITGRALALEYNGSEVWISQRWDPIGLISLLKRYERLNLRAADLVFVVSDAERRNLIKAGVAEAKIIVNPNGVDPSEFRPQCGGQAIRERLGIADRIVVGFIGTFGPWHGAPALAAAAAQVSPSARCHFLFIGDGDERPQTEALIAAHQVSATFIGRIAHPEAPAYLDACDILASPHVPSPDGSEFFGSPTKLFEYLAMARPIVASRLGQIADVIHDEENGLLVAPGHAEEWARAFERLASDAELRNRLGVAARQTAMAKYTWQHNAARVFAGVAKVSIKG